MADVPVIGPAGIVKYVDSDEAAAQGLPSGFRMATGDEAQKMALEKEYGGVGHQLAAAGTGLLQGGLMVSDAAIAEWVPGGREALQAYEAIHPTERAVGEAVGAVGSAFVPGGAAGTIGKGAKFLSAPARAAMGAGRAVEAGVGATRLGRLGGMAAGQAVEGALWGAGEAISESAIYDTELTGQHLAASMGYSALLGGSTAFGLGAAGKLLGKGARKGADLLRRGMQKADGSPGALAKTLGTMSEVVSGHPKGSAVKALADHELTLLAKDAPKFIKRETVDLMKHFEKMHTAKERWRQMYSGAMKADEVARKVTTGNEKATRAAVMGWLDEASAVLDDIKLNEASISQRGQVKIRREVAAMRGLAASSGGGNTSLMMGMDGTKRAIQKLAYQKLGVGVSGVAEQALYKRMDALAEGSRGLLENVALWGDAALMQKDINKHWVPFIRSGADTGWERILSKPASADKGARIRIFNREGVEKALSGIHAGQKETLVRGLMGYMDDATVFTSAVKRNRSMLSAGDSTLATEMGVSIDALRTSLGRVKAAEEGAAHLASLRQVNAQGEVIATGLGYAVGGPLGAVLGGAIGALRNPYGMVTKIAAARDIAGIAARKMSKASGKLFSAGTKNLNRVGQAAYDAPTKKAEYDAAAKRARWVADNKDEAKVELEDSLAGLSDHAPAAATGAVATALRANDYAIKHMPEMRRTTSGREMAPMRHEMNQWLRRLRAIDDPSVLMRDISNGDLKPETIDAVREVYPALYEDMRADVAAEFADMRSNGKDLPYTQRIMLGALLELQTDPTNGHYLAGLLAAGYEAAPPDEEQGGGVPQGEAPQLSAAFETETERLMARE